MHDVYIHLMDSISHIFQTINVVDVGFWYQDYSRRMLQRIIGTYTLQTLLGTTQRLNLSTSSATTATTESAHTVAKSLIK